MVQCKSLIFRLRLEACFLPTQDGEIMSELQPPRNDFEKAVINLDKESLDVVQAEMVRINQSAVQEITAEEIGLTMSGSFHTKALNVIAHESGMALVDAEKVEMTNSSAGVVMAEYVDAQGCSGIVLANSVELGATSAGIVAGRDVHAEKIESLVFFGRHVEGDVQAVVDTRGALIGGMVGGLLSGLIILTGRFLFPRK